MVYLTISEKSYPRKLAFSYLDELSKEFATNYGPQVDSTRKPYAFVRFGIHFVVSSFPIGSHVRADTFMSKTTRLYQDTRAATGSSGLDRLNDELQDVTRIMTKNMEELLWRGDSLDSEGILLPLNFSNPSDQECRICRLLCALSPKDIAKLQEILIFKQ